MERQLESRKEAAWEIVHTGNEPRTATSGSSHEITLQGIRLKRTSKQVDEAPKNLNRIVIEPQITLSR